MLKQEWLAIFKDKIYFAAILVMFIMPLLYCGMLLWSNWDPYGQVDNLPVALVNNDKSADFEGEELHIGDELVKNLEENASFDFKLVSDKKAKQMLDDKDVYIIIEIPENFSENATTLLDDNPKKLDIKYTIDQGNNFIASKIGDTAIEKIRTEVNEQISKTYAEQLFAAIEKLSDGYGDAADGAVKIKDGVVELKDSTESLKDYLYELAKGTVTLSNSTSKLADGATSAKSGAGELAIGADKLLQGSGALKAGAGKLQEGAANLSSGVSQYTAGVDQAAAGQQQLLAGQKEFQTNLEAFSHGTGQVVAGSQDLAVGTEQLATGIEKLNDNLSGVLAMLPEDQRKKLQDSLSDLEKNSNKIAQGASGLAAGATNLQENSKKLANAHSTIVANSEKISNGLGELSSKSGSLVDGATQIANGSTSLTNNFNQFHAGVSSLSSGVNSLNNGLGTLADGAKKLSDGTATLSDKTGQLADGSKDLVDGTSKLADGSDELANSLKDAKDDSSISVSDKNYEMVASSVEVDKNILNSVDNYGSGLAPYFISLGLFVGALILTNVYNFVQPSIHPTGLWTWFISKSSVPFVVWIFQFGILSFVLLFVLKLHVTNVPLFLLLMAVTSFCFLAIIQLLVAVLDDVGRFIALIFLILQLASSAGTFPVQLIPKPLQAIHSLMPMTYSVNAFRDIISSTEYNLVYHNIGVLAVIGLVCVICTFLFFALLYKRRYSKTVTKAEA